MRQVLVTCPFDKADLVVEAIQNLGVTSVLRYNAEVASVITTYASPQLSGFIMHELDKIGCGSAYGRIALTPVEVLKPLPKSRVYNRKSGGAEQQVGGELCRDPETAAQIDNGASVKARLAIEEIYSDIQGQSNITFDYMAFIVIASMIAGLGLATNNTVMILASMLVSPLMGPILAFTFGTVVKDFPLAWKGIKMEILGVLLTLMVGFLLGLALSGMGPTYAWPTAEMTSRGEWFNLVIGVLFAVPSGAGVALAVTGGGSNSLVGVAIAAALLPPVVNTGLCFGYAAVGPFMHPGEVDALLFVEIGGVSFLLFFMNVCVIYVVCVVFFKIKSIKPIRRELSNWADVPKITIKPRDEDLQASTGSDSASTSQKAAEAAWKPSAGLMAVFRGPKQSPEEAQDSAKKNWAAAKAALRKQREDGNEPGFDDLEFDVAV